MHRQHTLQTGLLTAASLSFKFATINLSLVLIHQSTQCKLSALECLGCTSFVKNKRVWVGLNLGRGLISGTNELT